VQTITSSVDFVTGSTRFGSLAANTHQFTGSLLLNGSSSIQSVPNGVDEYYYLSAKGSYGAGFSIYEYSGVQYINASSSMFLRYNNAGSATGSSSGIFAIASGSSEVLRITAAGNVNIGRTDNFYKFSISSGFPKTETNAKGLMFIGSNEAIASNPFGLVVLVTGAASIANRYVALGTTDFGLANGGNLVLQSSGGNVGIGTTTPTALLHLSSSANTALSVHSTGASNYASINFVNNTTGYGYDIGFGGSTTIAPNSFYVYGGSSVSVKFLINSGGNVGINTTAPSFAAGTGLMINDASRSNLTLTDGTNVFNIFQTGTDGYTDLRTNGNMIWRTSAGNLQRMKISADGNFDYGGYAVLASNNPTYRQAFYGGLSIMWRGFTDFYLNSNHTYGSSNTNIASYSSTEGIGRLGISGGSFEWGTYNGSVTANSTYSLTARFSILPSGYIYFGNGYSATSHRINLATGQGNNVLVVSGYDGSANDTAKFMAVSGAGGNAAASALWLATNSSTGRSITAGGAINASGTDYAEYIEKAITDTIAKGDIVGINSEAKLTNIFNNAVSFVVKSTDPSYVGGDVWGNKDAIGKKPERTTDQTEEEFAPILAEFEAKLEEARAKVDRIAFSGQVPCNVTGANVGDYIIPIELENGKIGGQAVTTPTFEQYQISVGKVWKIMEDGRAWIAVKIG